MDKEQDDLTLVYMWAYKQAKQEYKDRIEQLEAALQRANATTEEYERKFYLGSDRIEQLEAALRKIAAIEDEVINVPKTEEGAHLWTYLWTALDMCFELSEAALGENTNAHQE